MAKYRKLGKTSDQRKALLRNQVTNLIYHGRIITTEARAKEVRKIAEGLIAMAVKERDNFEEIEVEQKVPKKTADGKRVKELVEKPDGTKKKKTVYETVTKTLFDTSETFYQNLVDRYFEQVIPCTYYEPGYWNSFTYDSQTPLSVIKTYELQNLADATHALLQILLPDDKTAWPDLSKQYLIYYCGNFKKTAEDCMYDMNDIVLHLAQTANTEEAMAAYLVWKEVFDRCVVYRKCPQEGWMSGNQIQPYVFKSGILNDARYGGVSMFVPQDRKGSHYYPYTDNGISYDGYNADIKKTSWYQAARLSDFGW